MKPLFSHIGEQAEQIHDLWKKGNKQGQPYNCTILPEGNFQAAIQKKVKTGTQTDPRGLVELLWLLSPVISGAASPQSFSLQQSHENIPKGRPCTLQDSARFLLSSLQGFHGAVWTSQVSRSIMPVAGWRIPQKRVQDALEIWIFY